MKKRKKKKKKKKKKRKKKKKKKTLKNASSFELQHSSPSSLSLFANKQL